MARREKTATLAPVEDGPMTVALWYVVAVHCAISAFFLRRWWQRRKRHPEAKVSLLIAYLALGPAVSAARELQVVRVNIAGALTLVSALLGSLLLAFIWDAHFRHKRQV